MIEIEMPDGTIAEFPDGMDMAEITAILSQQGEQPPQERPIPKFTQPVPQQEPIGWLEKQFNKIPNLRAGIPGGVMQGMADPGIAIAQMVGNATPYADEVNQAVSGNEQRYQALRQDEGIDWPRMGGNIAMTAAPGGAIKAAPSLVGRTAQGAGMGLGYGLLNPVTDGDFLEEKAKQAGIGALTGGAMAPLVGGVSRLISPKASTNPDIALTKAMKPTIGQTLGGFANRTEEKAQSLPILGDAITWAKRNSRDLFNIDAMNRVANITGQKVTKPGIAGVDQLEAIARKAYDDFFKKAGDIQLDKVFVDELGSVRKAASSLTPSMAKRFENILADKVISRIPKTGKIASDTIKRIDADVGDVARSYSKQTGSEGELGLVLKQLRNVIQESVARKSPELGDMFNKANLTYAQMKAIKKAAEGAVGKQDGKFTPAQLANQFKKNDSPSAKEMRDYAMAAERMIGSKYPDSGTAGRMFMDTGLLVGGALNPQILAGAAGLGAAASAYLPQMQGLLSKAAASRPQQAAAMAESLRNLTPAFSGLSGLLIPETLHK